MTNRCINIDWLEVYALEPEHQPKRNQYYFESQGYHVIPRDYGTRVYKEMFTICDDHDVPMIEVRREPASQQNISGGLFPAESCHLRLTNCYCYSENPIQVLREFMVKHDYTLGRIFRIDICSDFEKFDRGDEPLRFLKRYMAGKYSKMNQSNVSAHGRDTWEERKWNSLSWGQRKSMIYTKFYNKSQELRECQDKPYIRWAWCSAGLIDNPINMTKRDDNGQQYTPEIWRVEFTISSSARKWFVVERSDTRKPTKSYYPHTLDMYDNSDKLLAVFASLAHHYFRFKYFEEGVRKDRCRDKVLFDFSAMDKLWKVDRMASHKPSKTKTERLITLLLTYKQHKIEPRINHAIDTIVSELRQDAIREFAGTHWNDHDTLVLQRLLAERVTGTIDKSLEQHTTELKEMVEDLFDTIY